MNEYARPPDPEEESLKILSSMAATIEELGETPLTKEQNDLINRLEADCVKLLALVTDD